MSKNSLTLPFNQKIAGRQMKQYNLGDIFFFSFMALVGYGLFLWTTPLFDWDEINFAESAREMIASGNYFQVQINFQPFWEKPPLFFWMQVLAMKAFGINEFAARFPNAVIGLCTILSLYFFGCRFKDRLFGRLLAALYMGALLPSAYFKSGIIDPTFNFFIFMGLIHLFEFEIFQKQAPELRPLDDYRPYSAGIFIGLATLTKGPVAILVVALIYVIYKLLFNRSLPLSAWAKVIFACCVIIMGWFGMETMVHGTWFVETFFKYQIELFTKPVAEHGQPFYYHFVVFLALCFPLSAFTFRAMFMRQERMEDTHLHRFMVIWFWVVMILFSLSTTKIVHYSSLLYFPAAFLTALYLYKAIKYETRVAWETKAIFLLQALILGILPACINALATHAQSLLQAVDAPDLGMIRIKTDIFTMGNLSMPVAWTGYEWLIGAIFLVGLIWNFRNLHLRRYISFVYLQMFLMLFFLNGLFAVILPKVARYAQGSPMDFYAKLKGKDVYYLPANYKSYLPYFYGEVKPYENKNAYNPDWLITGEVDKDVYISTKNMLINEEFQRYYHHFTKLYEEGGFVFFVRKVKKEPEKQVTSR
ncbi:MAG: ArnT family glycosyltransferase [Bacteroidia bacterium]